MTVKDKVSALLAIGLNQTEVARQLSISPQRVSQITNEESYRASCQKLRVGERDVTRQIIALLQTLGAYVLKIHGHGMQRRGVPDLACVYKGFAVWIEVKSPNARRGLSPEQQTEIAAIQAAGGVAFEARCIEDVLLGLETIEPKLRERVKVT